MYSRAPTHIRSIAIFSIIVTVMVAFVPGVMGQVSIQPTLSISPLDPQAQEVEPDPEDIMNAMYTATVTVSKLPAIGTVTVHLAGSCTAGFPTIVSPDEIAFTTPGSVEITIQVIVPQAAYTSVSRVQVDGDGEHER